jgi:trehalose/maltose hydrolase-like predicted phosphorylase
MEIGPFRLYKEISQTHQFQTHPNHQVNQPKKNYLQQQIDLKFSANPIMIMTKLTIIITSNKSSNNADQNNTESTIKSPIFIKGVLDFPE